MPRSPLLIALVAAAASAFAGDATRADDWWNAAWTHRKRVRVPLAPEEPLGFTFRPPKAPADDVVAAQATIQCEAPLKGTAQNAIRVVDAGGNLLPCSAAEPDARGLVRIVFPARRTIAAALSDAIGDNTASVRLTAGRDKAVTPGMRFYAVAGSDRIATLEVETVAAKESTARVVDKSVPNIAKGTPARSAVLADGQYWIYYGNPKPSEAAPQWTPPAASVVRYGWRVTQGGTPTSLPHLRQVMRSSPSYVGSHSGTAINSRSNPLDYDSDSYYVSVYESIVRCDVPGLYRFAIDSGGPAFLLINGSPAAQRPGFFHQTGQFEHRGKIELAKGYHRLTLCAVESGRRYVTRLAWQPIMQKTYNLVPASFFVKRVEADVVAMETREQRRQVFFTHRLAPYSLFVHKARPYQFVQFHNATVLPEGVDPLEASYVWNFGDKKQVRDEAPGHSFPAIGDGASPAAFKVTLHAYLGTRLLGQYSRTVHCDPRPRRKLNVALDVVSFANVVYDDERTSIAVRLRNANFSSVVLRAVGRLHTPAGKQILLNRPVLIPAQDESFCVLPVDMKLLLEKRATIDLDVSLGDTTVLSTGARIVPSEELLVHGSAAVRGGQIILGPGGAFTGVVAATPEFPTTDYEILVQAMTRKGTYLCDLSFPVGDHHLTFKPRNWNVSLEPGRWHELRVRVAAAAVEAWANDKSVFSLPRAKCAAELPAALETLAPFAVNTRCQAQVAVRKIAIRSLAEPAAEAKPAADTKPAEGQKPAEPQWTDLFDGRSLKAWRPVANNELAMLTRGLGTLHDDDGRRVMICARIEDPNRHLEWVFARYIHETHIASRRRVLIFGSRMNNVVDHDKSFTDYVGVLEQRFAKVKRPFQFVPRSTGLLPTLADIPLFGGIADLKPRPNVIVLSPGLSDVEQAVGVRDFVRSYDVMIDIVRAVSSHIKVIIVSPPPYPSNPRVSRLYTDALKIFARDHHIPFLNLHELLTQPARAPHAAATAPKATYDWVKTCYAIPDAEGLFFENPNEAAQLRIADAIEKLLD